MAGLQWKQTEIETSSGKVTVFHWKKHDPRELLKVLETKPLEELGRHPVVKVHDFGRHRIAVREALAGEEFVNPPMGLFFDLAELADKKLAIVEMPVALIIRLHRFPPVTVVTLWKKNRKKLSDFLERQDVSGKLKEKACLSAARELAKLHAAGFTHGHPHLNNFLVNEKRGDVKLVDYSLLKRDYFGKYAKERDYLLILLAFQGVSASASPDEIEEFKSLLRKEYGRVYDRLRNRFKPESWLFR